MRALPPALPSPEIAELISVASERAQLKECIREHGQHREDIREHNDCEECVHRPPFVTLTLANGRESVIGEFADPGGRNY
jgi:hypothetical protein